MSKGVKIEEKKSEVSTESKSLETEINKISRSDPKDPNKANVVQLSIPFFGHSKVSFEHVIKAKKDSEEKTNPSKRYAYGETSVVKKVYSLQRELVGAVKIVKKKSFLENEVKYQAILGREVLFGSRGDKWYIFMRAYKVTLAEYVSKLEKYFIRGQRMDFPVFTVEQRLQIFNNYLQQAKIIHDRGEVLGDPKTTNAMLDWEEKSGQITNPTLAIIDFGSVHNPEIQQVTFGLTRMYLSPNLIRKKLIDIQNEYSLKDDIFIFGHMLAELFPEFFKVIFDEENLKSAKINPVQNDGLSYLDNEIARKLYALISSMLNSNPMHRPDIDNCIEQLSEIIRFPQVELTRVINIIESESKSALLNIGPCFFRTLLNKPDLGNAFRKKLINAVIYNMDFTALEVAAGETDGSIFELLSLIEPEEIKQSLIDAVMQGNSEYLTEVVNWSDLEKYQTVLIEIALIAARNNKFKELSYFPRQIFENILESKPEKPICDCLAKALLFIAEPDQEDSAISAEKIVSQMPPAAKAFYMKVLQAGGYSAPSKLSSNQYKLIQTPPDDDRDSPDSTDSELENNSLGDKLPHKVSFSNS